MPKNYFKGMSSFQACTVTREIENMEYYNKERLAAANRYTGFLSEHGKYHVAREFTCHHMFLKYPILVSDRASFLQAAEREKIELGDWFNSPLHPVQGDLSAWGLNPDRFPNAKHISTHIVNLPTRSNTEKVINFLRGRIEELM